MSAISDPGTDFDATDELRRKLRESGTVNHGGRVFFGSVLTISALGIWAVPVADGDAAMQLIKLLVSVVLAGVGVMFFLSVDRGEALPEIRIDPKAREIRVVTPKSGRKEEQVACHRLDDLAEITLRDGHLSARDASGQMALSVPVRDQGTEAALRAALNHAA